MLVVLSDTIDVDAVVGGGGDCSVSGGVCGGFFICNVCIGGSSSPTHIASLARIAQTTPLSEFLFCEISAH